MSGEGSSSLIMTSIRGAGGSGLRLTFTAGGILEFC